MTTAPDYAAPVANPQLEAIEDIRLRIGEKRAELEPLEVQFGRMLLDAYEAEIKVEAICRAAGFTRQRLHQVLAVERRKRETRAKRGSK